MTTGWVIAITGMILLSIADIRERKIPVIYLAAFCMASSIYTLFFGTTGRDSFFFSLLPGFFLRAVSLCTREGIGYGDGWTVMALGLLTGADSCFAAVCAGLVLTALCSLSLLALHKVSGKSRIPFLPFLTIGLGVGMLVQKGI